MKIRLIELIIYCRDYHEIVPFGDITYFHGQMGAGKSTIARLIDFCLGGTLDTTPALESEFVSAQLTLEVNGHPLFLERSRSSTTVHAQWQLNEELHEALIPSRSASGVMIPDTEVEVLSDLFFYLAGMKPPRVRRSKLREDSELGRLSLRDLLWYCYLDQDTIDSDFFHLGSDANPFMRLKSRDVLRFILGFHQEKVSELEAQLEELRTRRMQLEGGAEALKLALEDANVSSQSEIDIRLSNIQSRIDQLSQRINGVRMESDNLVEHATEDLRMQGRTLADQLSSITDAISSLEAAIRNDRSHLNELRSLSTKFRRMTAARAVLNDVEFRNCPRCAKPLPPRDQGACGVCGQPDTIQYPHSDQIDVADADLIARVSEITETITYREVQLAKYTRLSAEVKDQKVLIDRELDRVSRQYDSAYLSHALALEQERARLQGEASQLERLRVLPQRVEDQLRQASQIKGTEESTRAELKNARVEAEKDSGNLRKLEKLFLDCLVRAQVPGFSATDIVRIQSPQFLPEVSTPEEKEMIITSFANLGSGGKKTLFKCCFAIAIHRLAVNIGAVLPTFLIIDSPMKNISERENRHQFEGFHRLLYSLMSTELLGTQIILIDKEYLAPAELGSLKLVERQMSPDQPLLRGFKSSTPNMEPDKKQNEAL